MTISACGAAAVLSLVYQLFSLSTWTASGTNNARNSYSGMSYCHGTVYLVYRDKNRVIANKVVALGGSNNILSHALIKAVGVEAVSISGEAVTKHGYQSAAGSFVYEIANSKIRTLLFNIGLVDTTVLSSQDFYQENKRNKFKNYIILEQIKGNGEGLTQSVVKRKKTYYKKVTVGAKFTSRYMKQNYSRKDIDTALCS